MVYNFNFFSFFYSPMLLKDIKSKIETTEIGSIEELQLNLMLMSYNTVMTNPAGTSSVKEATDLQVQLKYNCRVCKMENFLVI